MRLCLHGKLLIACLLGACSSLPPPAARHEQDAATADCRAWFQRLDAVIDQAGVRDAEAHRPPGYPHLRSNRLLASFADEATRDHDKYPDWLRALRALDQRARELEIGNLAQAAIQSLAVVDKSAVLANSLRCGNLLVAADLRSPDAAEPLRLASRVPDSYSASLRGLGVYPLLSLAFFDGILRWQQRAAGEFDRQRAQPFDSTTMTRYVPAPASEDSAGSRAPAGRDALGIPRLDDGQRDALLAAHAPVFEIVTRRDDDRPGALAWRNDQSLAVETALPTVYQRVAFTRLGSEVLTQLVYTVWFPRRTSAGVIDPVAGELDGVIFRITLDREGQPLLADSIHACGCYHEFFPGPRATPRPAPQPREEWAFAPAPLPPLPPGTRFALRLAAGTHYLIRIGITDTHEGLRYARADENGLRALVTADGSTRSIYGPDGLIAASRRSERFLFWPMGIASAGAMRQWGGHATAFVGRRHFDDADLIDRRFTISAGPP